MGENANKNLAILMREANRFPTLTVEREHEIAVSDRMRCA